MKDLVDLGILHLITPILKLGFTKISHMSAILFNLTKQSCKILFFPLTDEEAEAERVADLGAYNTAPK